MRMTMTELRGQYRTWMVLGVLLVLSASNAVSAQEPALTITVTQGSDNRPVAGASVCMAITTNGATKQTDSQGVLVIPNPPAGQTLKVFVTKEGFDRTRNDVLLTGESQSLAIGLVPGNGGASSLGINCNGTPAARMILNAPRITAFKIVSDTRDGPTTDRILKAIVALDVPAAFYRIGESRDLTGATWRRFPSTGGEIEHRIPGEPFGTRALFVQVKPTAAEASISAVATTSIVSTPTQGFEEYTLSGDALRAFVKAAEKRGYRFTYFAPRPSPVCPSPQFLAVTDRDLETDRKTNNIAETINARFDVFDGPDLLPFWRIKTVVAAHINLMTGRAFSVNTARASRPQVELTTSVENPQPGRPQAAKRSVRYTRVVYAEEKAQLQARGCVAIGEPALTVLTLEGPANQDPLSALGRR